MIIRASKDKFDVNINIRNSKDNAYNTKIILSFTHNINYVKVEVRFGYTLVSLSFEWQRINGWVFFFFFFLDFQPEKDCSLDNSKVECAVGYPFLGNNFEVCRDIFSFVQSTVPPNTLCVLQLSDHSFRARG